MLSFLPALLLLIVQGSIGTERIGASVPLAEVLAFLCEARTEQGSQIGNAIEPNDLGQKSSIQMVSVAKFLIRMFESESELGRNEPQAEYQEKLAIDSAETLCTATLVASKLHPNRAGPL